MRNRISLAPLLALAAGVSACAQASLAGSEDGRGPGSYVEFSALEEWGGILTLTVAYTGGGATSPYHASITAVNTGAAALEAETGPSGWWFRLYAGPDRAGDPIWQGRSRTPQDIGEIVSIAPGSSRTFLTARLVTAEGLLGTRQPGTYFVSAALAFYEPASQRTLRTAFFPAGELIVAP